MSLHKEATKCISAVHDGAEAVCRCCYQKKREWGCDLSLGKEGKFVVCLRQSVLQSWSLSFLYLSLEKGPLIQIHPWSVFSIHCLLQTKP